MNLIEFIRLIKKNLLLLVFIPLVMVFATYFFTKNADREFTSTTMLYTGLATGFNIESTGETRKDQFVVNNSFENLLNTIRSRETLKEVGFRLIAECLALPKADGKYINPKTFEQLNEWFPKELRKGIVVANNPAATYQNLLLAYDSGQPRKIQELFNEAKTPFSLKTLNEMKAVRKGHNVVAIVMGHRTCWARRLACIAADTDFGVNQMLPDDLDFGHVHLVRLS